MSHNQSASSKLFQKIESHFSFINIEAYVICVNIAQKNLYA